MARILVVGAEASIAQRRLLDQLVARMRGDGHDAVAWRRPEEGAARSIREADAVVALLDGIPADAGTAIALAHAMDKPCLGLATRGQVAPLFADLTRLVQADAEDTWWAALAPFYDEIRPFAGRLVRDRIPQLVKDAGHDVQFRSLGAQERPRFLKQKIATEAKELLGADLANEKEEVADVLEALEAFILARGFDRDDLRRIKDHKKKQRGGFERAFVVEATTRSSDGPHPPAADAGGSAQDPSPAQARTAPAARHATQAAGDGHATPSGFGVAQRAAQAARSDGPGAPGPGAAPEASATAPAVGPAATRDEVDPEHTQAPETAVDDVAQGRDVRATFFEI